MIKYVSVFTHVPAQVSLRLGSVVASELEDCMKQHLKETADLSYIEEEDCIAAAQLFQEAQGTTGMPQDRSEEFPVSAARDRGWSIANM